MEFLNCAGGFYDGVDFVFFFFILDFVFKFFEYLQFTFFYNKNHQPNRNKTKKERKKRN